MKNLPDNWIDKIFKLLGDFYGDRWSKQFTSDLRLELYKTMWFNGLRGLSYDQLRHGLAVCKKYSVSSYAKPPNVILFYHYCIGLRVITNSKCST